jgi:prephenate dehydrogenase
MNNHLTVTIVGGGNSAHVLIPFLKRAGYKVNLMTRRPDDWQETVVCELTDMKNSLIKTFHGTIDLKSKDPSVVIPDADVIILCMPVHQYRDALDRIGPYINRTKEVSVNILSLFHETAELSKFFPPLCHNKEVYVGTM